MCLFLYAHLTKCVFLEQIVPNVNKLEEEIPEETNAGYTKADIKLHCWLSKSYIINNVYKLNDWYDYYNIKLNTTHWMKYVEHYKVYGGLILKELISG